jgi:cell division septation protein DedD
MAKDYAKQFNKQSSKKRSSRKWVVIGMVVLVVLIGSGLFIKFEVMPVLSGNPAVSAFFSRIHAIFANHSDANATHPVDAKTDPESDIHFSFYSELPKMRFEVSKPQEAVAVSHEPEKKINKVEATPITQKADDETSQQQASASVTTQPEESGYVLQFGLFKDAAGASQLRLSLLLSGIETEVKKTQDQQQDIYRVQQGPYSNASEAKSFQQKWHKKGVESMVKKL